MLTLSTRQLLSEWGALGIRFYPSGDDGVAIDAPKGVLTPLLVEAIKEQKSALLEILLPARDPYADWRVRTHASEGRLVLYDANEHDGSLIWPDKPESVFSPKITGKSLPSEPLWPHWLADFVLLLSPDDLPDGLRLDTATIVAKPAKCLASLRADIARGGNGPRASVLAFDLEQLRAAIFRHHQVSWGEVDSASK